MTSSTTCNTERDGGLTKFLYDSNSGNYVLLGDVSEDELYGNLRRKLPQQPAASPWDFLEDDGMAKNPIIPISFSNERSLDQQENPVIYGRRCTCARTDDVYCPVGAYLCRIIAPNSRTYRVQCEEDAYGVAGRFILPLVVFMYVFFSCLLVASPKGKYARGFLTKILRCWKEDRYQRELRQEIDLMAQRNYRQRLRAQRRNPNRVYYGGSDFPLGIRAGATVATATAATVEVAQRVAVGLKTSLYTTHEQERTNECTICLGEFLTGDKVGDLPCCHIFHAACLKKWIVRRNHCPLCQADNLAAPTAEVAMSSKQLTSTDEVGTGNEEELRSSGEQSSERNQIDSAAPRENAAVTQDDR